MNCKTLTKVNSRVPDLGCLLRLWCETTVGGTGLFREMTKLINRTLGMHAIEQKYEIRNCSGFEVMARDPTICWEFWEILTRFGS